MDDALQKTVAEVKDRNTVRLAVRRVNIRYGRSGKATIRQRHQPDAVEDIQTLLEVIDQLSKRPTKTKGN